ncbi:MAG: TM1812 family CRISPR-associated protein [Treponema sp.]|nr:TM1812 family CRISPR-associated protein [Treponema sp.]
MKKIVLVPLKMSDDMKKRNYPVDGNSFIEYEKKVYYAINAVLAKTLKSDDDVKIILLETNAGEKAGVKNAKIDYEIIPSDFITSKEKSNELYVKLLKNLEYEAEIYADITFGPKTLTMLITAAMQFGEKFFDCSIGNVIYLKAEWKDNKIIDGTQLICDYTPLYLLNSFTNTMESTSGEKAIKAIETLFED